MFKEIVPLIAALKGRGMHITVETAGTVWQGELPAGSIDLASVSPKLSNSTPWQREGGRFAAAHEHGRIKMEVLKAFAAGGPERLKEEGGAAVVADRQWKFVVSSADNLREIETLLEALNAQLPAGYRIPATDVMLMPEGTEAGALTAKSRQLAEVCKERGYRLSPRLHVYLWGNTKGT